MHAQCLPSKRNRVNHSARKANYLAETTSRRVQSYNRGFCETHFHAPASVKPAWEAGTASQRNLSNICHKYFSQLREVQQEPEQFSTKVLQKRQLQTDEELQVTRRARTVQNTGKMLRPLTFPWQQEAVYSMIPFLGCGYRENYLGREALQTLSYSRRICRQGK